MEKRCRVHERGNIQGGKRKNGSEEGRRGEVEEQIGRSCQGDEKGEERNSFVLAIVAIQINTDGGRTDGPTIEILKTHLKTTPFS